MNRLLRLAMATLMGLTIIGLAGATVLAAFDPVGSVCQNASDATVCIDAANAQSDNAQSNHIYGKDGIFTKGANIISVIIGITSVIFIVVAGLKFVTAGGNAQQISSARRTILFAVIGVIVALISQAMIFFVLKRL